MTTADGATVLTVAAIATSLDPPPDVDAFAARLEAQVAAAAAAGAVVAVLPEYCGAALLALDPRWDAWHEPLRALLTQLAARHGLALVGTWCVPTPAGLVNRATFVSAKGGVVHQDKIHLTPWERDAGLVAGAGLRLIRHRDTTFAICICYDIEFPLLAAAACAAGAEVLLVPSWTDDRAGFWRVRHCVHARAIEHQVVLVHAPLVGGAPLLRDYESACGAPGIIGPCDAGWPEAGRLAEGQWDAPSLAMATVDLGRLRALHAHGTVTPRRDARHGDAIAVASIAELA